jgi:hypothetical protein
MVTGALASSYHGRPRTTLDVDVVVAIRQTDIPILFKALTNAGLRVQEQKLRSAWKSDYRIATAQDRRTPHTLDIVFTDQKLDRRAGRILGMPTYYQRAESLVLAKLRMIKVTVDPERAATDRQDVRALLQSTEVNLKRLRKKAKVQSTLKILDEFHSFCTRRR